MAARSDAGLQHTVYLLAAVVLASRESDWTERLANVGIVLSPTHGIIEFVNAFQAAVDDHLFTLGRSTDTAEIAQRSAGEVLTALTSDRATTLFGSGADELRLALKSLSSKEGFAELGQRFFGNFLYRHLNFYLSRVTAAQVGSQSFPSVHAVAEFNSALSAHCFQSARIVREFCGDWYSKTEFQEGINPRNTRRFVAHAVNKIRAELARQEPGS